MLGGDPMTGPRQPESAELISTAARDGHDAVLAGFPRDLLDDLFLDDLARALMA